MRWVSSNFKEVLPDRLFPLTASLVEDDFARSVRVQYRNYGYQLPARLGPVTAVIGGKPYFNCDLLLHVGGDCWGLSRKDVVHLLGVQVEPSHDGQAAPSRAQRGVWLRRLRAMWMGWRSAKRVPFPPAPPSGTSISCEPTAAVAWERAIDDYRHALLEHLQVNMAAGVVCRAVELLCERLAPNAVEISRRLYGDVGGTISSDQQHAFRQLFTAVKQAPAKLPAAQAEHYFRWFGHRCRYELEIGIPRPAEDMDHFLAELRKVDLPASDAMPADSAALRSPWTWRHAARHTGWAGATALTVSYHCRRWWLKRREASKYRVAARAYQLRQAALLAGSTLQPRGLEHAGDVFWLTKDELEAGLADSSWRVDAAMLDRRRQMAASAVELPELLTTTHDRAVPASVEPPRRHSPPGNHGSVFHGVAVSPGMATGPVRVVRTEMDSLQIRQGEIVVMQALDNGSGVVFMGAAGIITEVGGTLSHAAIVARELSIPAVFNVPNAQLGLVDGTIVTVDGDRGVVSIVQPRDSRHRAPLDIDGAACPAPPVFSHLS